MDAVPRPSPSTVGARAELAVAAALVAAGRRVYTPFFAPDDRVDLVAEDIHGRLQRVQCKTSRFASGAVMFRVCSNTRNVPKIYDGEIDLFGVHSPELDAVFLVLVADVATRMCYLRVDPPANGQRRGIRSADDYRIA